MTNTDAELERAFEAGFMAARRKAVSICETAYKSPLSEDTPEYRIMASSLAATIADIEPDRTLSCKDTEERK